MRMRYPLAQTYTPLECSPHRRATLSSHTPVPVARTLLEIAEHCGAALEGDGSGVVIGPADLAGASAQEISFLGNPLYEPQLATTSAAAVLVDRKVVCERADLVLLRVDDPSRAFTKVIELFAEAKVAPPAGVHPSSVVDPSAEVHASASIGPLCVIAAGAKIGPGVVLDASVQVGAKVVLGENTRVFPGVVFGDRVVLGARCVIQAGAVIGADGFGFDPTAAGWSRIPQCGTVILGDDVDVGANSTIDRARFGATKIGNMVKIDNQVQIAHNIVLGDATLLCAQVGLAGSVTLGKRVVMAGQSGTAGHLTVGDGAQIAGASGVFSDVDAGSTLGGWPARPMREALREIAGAKRLPEMRKTIKELKRRVAELEGDNA